MKLLKVASLSGSLTLIKMGCGFLIGKIISVHLGPTGIALIGQIQSIVTMLTGIINSPTSAGIIKYTAKYNNKEYEYYSKWWTASLRIVFLIYIIILPITLIFSEQISLYFLDDQKYKNLIILICSILPITSLGTLITSILNAKEQYRDYAKVTVISTLLSTTLIIGMIYYFSTQGALIGISIQYAIIGLIGVLITYQKTWFKFRVLTQKIEKEHVLNILKYVAMAIVSSTLFPFAIALVRKTIIEKEGLGSCRNLAIGLAHI
ncbi:oligosaccharide flippase family protein [Halobacteriovorax sp. Y22]|uniref:oligosaccharide flippase family protein n=1 Tax=Halobacteriovorax sp. Y22 TaxID=2505978 RepID=UPI00108069CF|nr:oligosaccharide flippase family protein [Halobacteriovorax sp. Y22]TGD49300.1 hypothetical protein EP118_00415 [Halobacteriovorax sp. Y22]